jgi:hypothetical protein
MEQKVEYSMEGEDDGVNDDGDDDDDDTRLAFRCSAECEKSRGGDGGEEQRQRRW